MSHLIDGKTGEVIGEIPQAAKKARRVMRGTTNIQVNQVIQTTILAPFIPRGAPITNRNPPPNPSAEQFARFLASLEKNARQMSREIGRQNPVIGAITDVLLDEFKKKRRGR